MSSTALAPRPDMVLWHRSLSRATIIFNADERAYRTHDPPLV